jgi:hypothetical protein
MRECEGCKKNIAEGKGFVLAAPEGQIIWVQTLCYVCGKPTCLRKAAAILDKELERERK